MKHQPCKAMTLRARHMEKQDIEMKWKLEMEIGNRNGNKKNAPITGAVFS